MSKNEDKNRQVFYVKNPKGDGVNGDYNLLSKLYEENNRRLSFMQIGETPHKRRGTRETDFLSLREYS